MKNEEFVEIKFNEKEFNSPIQPNQETVYNCRKALAKVINRYNVRVGINAVSMIVQDLYYAYGKEEIDGTMSIYKEWYDSENYSMLTEEEYKSLWHSKKEKKLTELLLKSLEKPLCALRTGIARPVRNAKKSR